MKIVHIINDLSIGGAEMMLYKLLANTDHLRFDITVISLKKNDNLSISPFMNYFVKPKSYNPIRAADLMFCLFPNPEGLQLKAFLQSHKCLFCHLVFLFLLQVYK